VCEVLGEVEHRMDVSRMASSAQVAFNALILSDKTQPKIDPNQVHVVTGSKALVDLLIACWEDGDERVFFDPKQGRDLRIQRKKKNGAFEIRPSMSARPIAKTDDAIDVILSGLYNLDRVYPSPSDDKVKEVADLADSLRDHVENSMAMKTKTGSVDNHNDRDGDDEEPAEIAKPTPKERAQAPTKTTHTVSKPAGAPKCFGDSTVFDPASEVCQECPHEFMCDSTIKRAGKQTKTAPSEDD
jgi:hypothetical protein